MSCYETIVEVGGICAEIFFCWRGFVELLRVCVGVAQIMLTVLPNPERLGSLWSIETRVCLPMLLILSWYYDVDFLEVNL